MTDPDAEGGGGGRIDVDRFENAWHVSNAIDWGMWGFVESKGWRWERRESEKCKILHSGDDTSMVGSTYVRCTFPNRIGLLFSWDFRYDSMARYVDPVG